ncbi:MAG: hypothetical protein Q4A46_07625 [Clostridia bacterium]|nr:hypothetical protein [Clostridia bacterium]
MDKLTLSIVKPLGSEENTIIARVPNKTLKQLAEISERTGIYVSQLTRMCIEFALPRIEIIEHIE